MPKEKEVYNFENKEKDAFVMIRDMNKDEESVTQIKSEYALEEMLWSSQFSIEDVEDFQTEFTS